MYGTTLVDSEKWGQTLGNDLFYASLSPVRTCVVICIYIHNILLGEEVTCVMNEQNPEIDFDVEQEYEVVWRSESQLNEKVIINTHEQVYHLSSRFTTSLSLLPFFSSRFLCVQRILSFPSHFYHIFSYMEEHNSPACCLRSNVLYAR